MKKLKVLMVLAAVMITFGAPKTEEHKNLKAFPEATDSTTRFVIELPHKERGEEDAFKVELIVGKTIETDGANRYRLGTTIEAMPLKGWGFTYYEMGGSGAVRSTRMAPQPGTPKVKKFVGGQPLTIRYNSRIPVVIYVPKGFEVRYRVWEAPAQFESVPIQ